MLIDTIKKCRSYRRFDNSKKISSEQLRSFAESARYTPSGANLQRLRFAVFTDGEACETIFKTLKFAGYLKDWSGPAPEQAPVGYVVVASESEPDTLLSIDVGICAEAIVLCAAEAGVGSCMFRSFSAEVIAGLVGGMKPQLVIAFGYPAETVVIEDAKDGEIKYYRDENDVHVVPKLTFDELFLN